jgi:hypothetical protein
MLESGLTSTPLEKFAFIAGYSVNNRLKPGKPNYIGSL